MIMKNISHNPCLSGSPAFLSYEDRHQSNNVFAIIVSIFNFNIYLI